MDELLHDMQEKGLCFRRFLPYAPVWLINSKPLEINYFGELYRFSGGISEN